MLIISLKLASMRKAQEFFIQPIGAQDTTVIIQSDKSIGQFDLQTGQGVLNTKGCLFPYLNKSMGAIDYSLSEEQLADIKKIAKAAGAIVSLGGGVVQSDNSGSQNL